MKAVLAIFGILFSLFLVECALIFVAFYFMGVLFTWSSAAMTSVTLSLISAFLVTVINAEYWPKDKQ